MKFAGWGVLGVVLVAGCGSSDSATPGGGAGGTAEGSGGSHVAGSGNGMPTSGTGSDAGSGANATGGTAAAGATTAGSGDGGDSTTAGSSSSGDAGVSGTGGQSSGGAGGNDGVSGQAGTGGGGTGQAGLGGSTAGNGGVSGQAGVGGSSAGSTAGGGAGGGGGNECPEGSTGVGCGTCVVYVNQSGGGDAATGKSWSSAKSTLQAGVETAFASASVCQVWVAKGTYVPNYKADPFAANNTATLQLRAGVALYGGFNGGEHSLTARNVGANVTTISGEIGTAANTDNLTRVVTGADGARLDGFTVTRSFGQAIECTAGTLTIDHCKVTDNQGGSSGGGLHVESTCAATVTNSTFTSNVTVDKELARGGAIFAEHGSLVVDNCSFSSNSATSGSGGAILSFAPTQIRNSTFDGNTTTGSGGGLLVTNLDALVENCTFNNNRADHGGGVSGDIALTVRGSTFTANQGRLGGAIYANALTIEDSTFSGNSAINPNAGGASGGAVRANGVVHIERSRFSNNTVSAEGWAGNGGALDCLSKCEAQLFDVAFDNNKAAGESANSTYGYGGAIAFNGISLTLANCQFTANRSRMNGGAIYHFGAATGSLYAYNSTFYGNVSAAGSGGAVYSDSRASTFLNTILWGDSAAVQGNEIFNYNTATSTLRGSDVQGTGFSGANGNIDQDPLFESTLVGSLDLRLKAGSPCINKGANADIPADVLDLNANGNVAEPLPLDVDGNARVRGASVDIGAHEAP